MNHKIRNTQLHQMRKRIVMSPKPTQPRRLDNQQQQHPHNYINFPFFLQ